MKFFFVLFLLIAVAVMSIHSCGSKLLGGAVPATAPLPPQVSNPVPSASAPLPVTAPLSRPDNSIPSPSIPSTTLQTSALSSYLAAVPPPTVVSVFTFHSRALPDAAIFISANAGMPVSVTPDLPSNSFLIRGPRQAVDGVISACSSLDLAPDEAYVDAWMLFVRGDNVKDFELSISSGLAPQFSANLSTSGFGVSLPASPLTLSLTALCDRGTVEVVDRPQLRLTSGRPSEVTTGDEVPFPITNTQYGVASTSIEFKQVGLLFHVDPLFLGAGRVRLDVRAENGLLGASQKIGDIEIPSISRQSVSTSATLQFDEAMVIGGLETMRREKHFGLFGKSEKTEAGRLYVCIMLRSGYPKAQPVVSPSPGLGIEVPGVQSVLPAKGWEGAEIIPFLDSEIDRVERNIRQLKGRPGG